MATGPTNAMSRSRDLVGGEVRQDTAGRLPITRATVRMARDEVTRGTTSAVNTLRAVEPRTTMPTISADQAEERLHHVILPCVSRPLRGAAPPAQTVMGWSPMRRANSSATAALCSSASRRADDGFQRPLASQIVGTKTRIPARST